MSPLLRVRGRDACIDPPPIRWTVGGARALLAAVVARNLPAHSRPLRCRRSVGRTRRRASGGEAASIPPLLSSPFPSHLVSLPPFALCDLRAGPLAARLRRPRDDHRFRRRRRPAESFLHLSGTSSRSPSPPSKPKPKSHLRISVTLKASGHFSVRRRKKIRMWKWQREQSGRVVS